MKKTFCLLLLAWGVLTFGTVSLFAQDEAETGRSASPLNPRLP